MKQIKKTRKQTLSLVIGTLLLTIILSSCTSKAAREVSQQITNIGDISIESSEILNNIEVAYNALNEKEKKQVKNYTDYITAKTEYDKIMEQYLEKQKRAEVENAYIEATTLNKNKLKPTYTSSSEGRYEYKGIPLLSEDCDWIDNKLLNAEGTVEHGAIYRKTAWLIEGFEIGAPYQTLAEVLIGYVPNTRDEFKPYVDNAKNFICVDNALVNVMKALETTSCVTGEFSYDKGKFGYYDIVIDDVIECAKDLKISNQMLGYILAALTEYGANIDFNDGLCHITYSLFQN